MSSGEENRKISVRDEILHTRLATLIVFCDFFNRYLFLRMKQYPTWIKVHALVFIISRGETLTPSGLAKLMLRSRNSITDLLNNLEKERLIKRVHSSQDRRKTTIKVTSKGITFAMSRVKRLTSLEEEIKGYIGDEELTTFVNQARKLRLKMIKGITGLGYPYPRSKELNTNKTEK